MTNGQWPMARGHEPRIKGQAVVAEAEAKSNRRAEESEQATGAELATDPWSLAIGHWPFLPQIPAP
jgi:hypothetical protein